MRTFREGILSSLVTRLTLAVIAVLLLSFGVTTAVFVTQAHVDDSKVAATKLLVNQKTVQIQVVNSVINAINSDDPDHPLADVHTGPPGIDRVLLTSWPNDAVVADTANGGGRPLSPIGLAQPINYHGQSTAANGAVQIGGHDYRYLALPLSLPESVYATAPPNVQQIVQSYHNVVMLEEVTPLSERAWTVVGNLAKAGVIAIIIASLAALAALRAITRPLHGMMVASERMAAGDYDQQVDGADSADEVGQLARAFNHMAAEVKRVREAQRQFIANVSHDLRSPLTSIIGFSQALTEDEATTPQQRHVAEIIHDEAERLSRLTMDLLDLSRLEAGRLTLSKHPLDLNATLRAIAARYQALPNKRGITFAAELSDEPLPVNGDPDRLTQVFVNLLDNALKFCNPGGEVRLSAARRGGTALVEVYNSGSGIAPEDLPHVFDRFYRADHSRSPRTGGSGIGLAIVRELVQAHGGAVTVSSELGRWTIMSVMLPLAAGAVGAQSSASSGRSLAGVSPGPRDGRTADR